VEKVIRHTFKNIKSVSEKSKTSYQYLSAPTRPSGHGPPYKVQSTTIRPCQSQSGIIEPDPYLLHIDASYITAVP
jgi:hypothetical protein